MNYLVVSKKWWNPKLKDQLKKSISADWNFVNTEDKLTPLYLANLKPDKIFILHWSKKIAEEIFSKYECISFHMTDLPFGRGGSPLQNLIIRGFSKTKITAIKVNEIIDGGDIYLKSELDLVGNAHEIFSRTFAIISEMITKIINDELVPAPQKGEITIFKRRTPKESNIRDLESLSKIYNYIRMLDADGYPAAFLETKYAKLEFCDASLKGNYIDAHVRITQK